jgi:hypothetical protein
MAVRFRCLQSKWADKQLTKVPSISYVPHLKTSFLPLDSSAGEALAPEPVSVAIRTATRFSMNYLVKH